MTLRPCIACGEPTERARCTDCALPSTRPSMTELGYDWHWRKLSARARRIQPWCSDCGTTEDLTTDHTPEAWRRKEQGLPIRLEDVDVTCRSCNSRRGAARGDRSRETWGAGVGKGEPPTHGKAQCESEIHSHSGGEA